MLLDQVGQFRAAERGEFGAAENMPWMRASASAHRAKMLLEQRLDGAQGLNWRLLLALAFTLILWGVLWALDALLL